MYSRGITSIKYRLGKGSRGARRCIRWSYAKNNTRGSARKRRNKHAESDAGRRGPRVQCGARAGPGLRLLPKPRLEGDGAGDVDGEEERTKGHNW